MSTLGMTEKELLLDYCLERLSPLEVRLAETLIERDAAAAGACDKIRAAVAPLKYVVSECPDELVDGTLRRLCALAAKADALELPSPRIVRFGLAQNLRHVAAVATLAACILLVVGTALPSFNFLRDRHYRQVCLGQLDRIFKSIDLYSSDHDDMLPAVARVAGASWHDVGGQEPGGYSNTRNLYLLLKLGYTRDPAEFVCCGGKAGKAACPEPSQVADYYDFPSRNAITYSYRVVSDPKTKIASLAAKPLMADMNPHFETLSLNMNVRPAEKTLHLNSINHRRRGQSVLYGDGHALFSRTRMVGDSTDDIYTIENTPVYHGYEWPTGPNDTFIAP